MSAESSESTPQRVWDAPTRLFHWSLAGLCALSWWTAEQHYVDLHKVSGLTILGLLVFRIYWGFAGSETSRFASFVKGPQAILAYASSLFGRGHIRAFGHNPLGALSVMLMLLALSAQVALGLFAMDTDGLESGPLARFVSYDCAQAASALHETVFNALLLLVAMHVAAIAFYLVGRRINLIGPMITGRMQSGPGVSGVRPAPIWRLVPGVLLAAGIALFVGLQ